MRFLSTALAVIVVLSGCSVTQATQALSDPTLTPEAYARSAVAQNQQQRTLGCAFEEGTYWSDDYASHRQWATGMSQQQRRQSYDYREQNLAACRQRTG